MTIKGKAYVAGIFEHPTRKADDKSLAQLHAEAAAGALGDAGLTRADVDGYFCAGDAPGLGGISMADYMGLKPHRHDGERRLVLCDPRRPRRRGDRHR
jgi:acetyl-CoA C-acetyltransferase